MEGTCRNTSCISHMLLFSETFFSSTMLAWEADAFLPACPVKHQGTVVISVSKTIQLKNALLLAFLRVFFLRTDFSPDQSADQHGGMEQQKLLKPVQGMDLEWPRKSGHLLLARKFYSPIRNQSSCYTSQATIPQTCWAGEKGLAGPYLFPEVTGKFSRLKNKCRTQRFATNRWSKKKKKGK